MDGLVHRSALGQVDSLGGGQVAEFGADVAQAGDAATDQGVGELDQPRVPADGADEVFSRADIAMYLRAQQVFGD